MSRVNPISLLVLLLAAMAIAGCGGSDSDTGDVEANSAPTKAEFIKQADGVCLKSEQKKSTKYQAFILKLHAGPSNPMTPAQEEELKTDIIIPGLRVVIEDFGALEPPAKDEAQINGMTGELEQIITELEEHPDQFSTKKKDPFTRPARTAELYGFKQCFLYY
jgi:hypothetical protein